MTGAGADFAVTCADWAKHGFGLVARLRGALELGEGVDPVEAATQLAVVEQILRVVVTVNDPANADMSRYSTGLPVLSMVELPDERMYGVVWHPEPDHESNRPDAQVGSFTAGDGTRRRIIHCGSGIFDVVYDDEGVDEG